MELNVNINENKKIRLQNYDYSQPGYYFVTICTDSRREFFGSVQNGRMMMNEIGMIALECWREIPERHVMIQIDEFVVMPNHVHGIVVIEALQRDGYNNGTPGRAATGLGALIAGSLSSIINHYKGAVKKVCNVKGFAEFKWQSRFYDHVIRKDESLDKIREYIKNNPQKWELDKNNPANIWM